MLTRKSIYSDDHFTPFSHLFFIIHTKARSLSQVVLITFHPDLLLTCLSTTFSIFIQQQFHINNFSQRSHCCACRGRYFCCIKKENLNRKHFFSFHVSTCIASTCRFTHIDSVLQYRTKGKFIIP